MDWLMIVAGLVLLVLAGDALVKGAVNLALRLGIPALIVSLTIVGFGTSAPEMLVSVQSVLGGLPEIALGNVVGSNIANVLLILGIPAMISVIHSSQADTRASYVQMLAVTAIFVALCFTGPLTKLHGVFLLVLLGGMLWHTIRAARQGRADAEVEGADPSMTKGKITLFLLAGLIGLPLGATLLIDGATSIARTYGVSEAIIGLTLVAVGTSLPELATTVMAAVRKQADVALGNVIGSNLFNLLSIMGITALIGDVPIADQFLKVDLWVMLASALALVPFVFFRRDIGKLAGAVLTGLYLIYLVTLL